MAERLSALQFVEGYLSFSATPTLYKKPLESLVKSGGSREEADWQNALQALVVLQTVSFQDFLKYLDETDWNIRGAEFGCWCFEQHISNSLRQVKDWEALLEQFEARNGV
ncbi:hypothetical protein KW797_00210 [Candidatus Parcubacteria bacterium]|nr:hypothetical protein [Candidatus Parcubacteria bacterium]